MGVLEPGIIAAKKKAVLSQNDSVGSEHEHNTTLNSLA